ncbi:MAG: glycosyltransferase family 39 protein [Anaerolineae bacterium]|nr:glycosyltransferase family 39 protein [Anaerolineae bacterium]
MTSPSKPHTVVSFGIILVVLTAVLTALPADWKFPAFAGVSLCSILFGIVWMRTGVPGQVAAAFAQGVRLEQRVFANRRSRAFIGGFALIGVAHVVMQQRDVVLVRFVFTEPLLRHFRLLGPNETDNFFLGLILLCSGVYCLIRANLTLPIANSLPDSRERTLPSIAALGWGGGINILTILTLLAILLWQMSMLDRTIVPVILWALLLLQVILFGYNYDRQAGTALALGVRRADWLILLGLLVMGLVVGAFKLDTFPNVVIGDETGFLGRAQRIAEGLEQQSFFGPGIYTFPIASSVYQAAFIKLFGTSIGSWRFSSVLISVLAVVPTYLLALKLFSRRLAVLTGVVMLTLPYFLSYGRMGYNNMQAVLPVAACLYCLYLAVERESLLYFLLGGIMAGLGFYTYSAGRLGLVAGVLIVGYLLYWRRGIEKRRLLLLSSGFIIAAALTFAPYTVFGQHEDPLLFRTKTMETIFPRSDYALVMFTPEELYRDYPPIEIDDSEFFFRPDLYAVMLASGTLRTLLAFHLFNGLVDHTHFVSAPLAGPVVSAIFYCIGLLFAVIHARQKELAVVLIWFFAGAAFLSILNVYPPRTAHLITIIPALAMLIALGIAACADFVAARVFPGDPRAPRIAAYGAAGLVAVAGVANYYGEVPRLYPPDPDNVIAFTVWQAQPNDHFVYVNDKIDRDDYHPGFLNDVPFTADFRAIPFDRLYNGGFLIPQARYTFFVVPEDEARLRDFLQEKFGEIPTTVQVYTNDNQQPILLTITAILPPA